MWCMEKSFVLADRARLQFISAVNYKKVLNITTKIKTMPSDLSLIRSDV